MEEEVGGGRRRFQVDVVYLYTQPGVFPGSSWNQDREMLGWDEYFVSGDNGFYLMDSQMWGPLDERDIFGET